MKTKYNKVAIHLAGELSGCSNLLSQKFSESKLHTFCSKFIKKYGFQELGCFFYTFAEGGITGIIALAESHVAIHTWPEIKYVTLDVFICNHKLDNTDRAKKLFQTLTDLFEATRIKVHEVTS